MKNRRKNSKDYSVTLEDISILVSSAVILSIPFILRILLAFLGIN